MRSAPQFLFFFFSVFSRETVTKSRKKDSFTRFEKRRYNYELLTREGNELRDV